MHPIGILGGTFDPIHYGHIKLANEVCKQLSLNRVHLIPLNIPNHRGTPIATPTDRKAMIELAIANEDNLLIDTRELNKEGISYSIDTLMSLRKEFPNTSICMIMGRDTFVHIDSWKDWESLLDYAHIVVATRPGESKNNTPLKLKNWMAMNKTDDLSYLKKSTDGYICFINIPALDISSSQFRENYPSNKTVNGLLPSNTLQYIKDNHLYLNTV